MSLLFSDTLSVFELQSLQYCVKKRMKNTFVVGEDTGINLIVYLETNPEK